MHIMEQIWRSDKDVDWWSRWYWQTHIESEDQIAQSLPAEIGKNKKQGGKDNDKTGDK